MRTKLRHLLGLPWSLRGVSNSDFEARSSAIFLLNAQGD